MSNAAPPTDWALDVKRYAPNADNGVIAGIVNYCLVALKTRDGALVSFGDPAETRRVRENFCKKKLGLTDSDDTLDAAIAAVGQRMSDTTSRHRVTVYYLLAEHFGKLGSFAAAAAAPAKAMAAAAAPLIMRGGHVMRATAGASDGFLGFAALVGGGFAAMMVFASIAGSFIGGRFDKEAPPAAVAPPPASMPTTEPAAATPPEGAGIVSEVVDGRPKVSVYFAVGKNDIAPEFTAAVEPVKAWLAANPGDRVQLSGFTDPTGDAAANAELAKTRAQAVQAALTGQGVAADRIDLVKPEDSSDEAADLAGARRVEITVTPG
jgi:outer membrane protein OmpA-like peptidoglycan-associated protein